MHRYLKACLFSAIFLICMFNACANARCRQTIGTEYGFYLMNHVNETRHGIGLVGCIQACTGSSHCKSVNIDLKRDVCEMNSASRDEFSGDLVKMYGTLYATMNN